MTAPDDMADLIDRCTTLADVEICHRGLGRLAQPRPAELQPGHGHPVRAHEAAHYAAHHPSAAPHEDGGESVPVHLPLRGNHSLAQSFATTVTASRGTGEATSAGGGLAAPRYNRILSHLDLRLWHVPDEAARDHGMWRQ